MPFCCTKPHPLDDESVRACMRNRARSTEPGRFRHPTRLAAESTSSIDSEFNQTATEVARERQIPVAAELQVPIAATAAAEPVARKTWQEQSETRSGFFLPAALHLELKKRGIFEGRSMTAIVREALEEKFAREPRTKEAWEL